MTEIWEWLISQHTLPSHDRNIDFQLLGFNHHVETGSSHRKDTNLSRTPRYEKGQISLVLTCFTKALPRGSTSGPQRYAPLMHATPVPNFIPTRRPTPHQTAE